MNSIVTIAAFVVVGSANEPTIERLLEDQHWEQAEAHLDEVSPERRDLYKGLIAHHRGDYLKAVAAFERAEKQVPLPPALQLYFAHDYLSLERFDDALRQAKAADAEGLIAKPLLMARAFEGLKRVDEAFSTLERALKKNSDRRLIIELAALTHRLGLDSACLGYAQRLVDSGLTKTEALVLMHLLYQDERAMPTLEALAVRWPDDTEVNAHLAYAYGANARWRVAARYFERASKLGGNYWFEAADQYRLVGDYNMALTMNAAVSDASRRLRQRVAILFEAKDYGRLVLLPEGSADDASRYKRAYANFSLGYHDRAAPLARKLIGGVYDSGARSLLKAMGRGADER